MGKTCGEKGIGADTITSPGGNVKAEGAPFLGSPCFALKKPGTWGIFPAWQKGRREGDSVALRKK
jgi:hypothetical protein